MAFHYMQNQDSARHYFEMARATLETEAEVHPDDHRIHEALGLTYAGLGMKKQAIRAAERAVGLFPLTRDAFFGTYFELRDLEVAARIPLQEALIHLKRACKRLRWQDEEGWTETIRDEIRQAEACLDVLECVRPPRSVAGVRELYDSSQGGR